jgi:DNA polymerase-1
MKATSQDAYQLIHEGAMALARVEAAGFRVDEDYLGRAITKTAKKIAALEERLKDSDTFTKWQRKFGSRTKLGNKQQLGSVMFDVLGHKRQKDNHKNDEGAFSHLDDKFVQNYFEIEKLKKAKSTYLLGIQRECEDGYVHAFMNLNTARSFRSSIDKPSLQNMPVRNDEMARIIRQSFIARDGHCIAEIDFSGIEVCGSACYNHDPVLISYIKDKTKDMHRDMASQCYKLDAKQVGKKIRYCAKNMYVFPEFYGSYYVDCSRNLWDAIDKLHLVTEDGHPLKEWLAKQGIKSLGKCDPEQKPRPGTFEHHIAKVEKDFWENRFSVYADWKKSWYKRYLERGYIDLLTGFRVAGVYRRNEIINIPIQGVSFHFLLWCLIQAVKWLEKKKMRSVIVCQIHDSIIADVHLDELEEFLAKIKEIMTVDLPRHWRWINVPLSVEAEVAPEGGSWYDKEKVDL